VCTHLVNNISDPTLKSKFKEKCSISVAQSWGGQKGISCFHGIKTYGGDRFSKKRPLTLGAG
jgi:hypothetical protein